MAVDELPSGRFRARLRIDGRTYSATFRHEEEALEWEVLTKARQISGTLYGHMTVQEYAAVWLSGYDAAPTSTRKFHGDNLRLYVAPRIGSTQLAKVTPTDITLF